MDDVIDVAMGAEDAGGALASIGRREDAGGPLVSMGRMEDESLERGIGGCTTLNTELDDFPAKQQIHVCTLILRERKT